MLKIDLLTLVRTYTRGQLMMLADGSRLLYAPVEGEQAQSDPTWVTSADTRQMTLKEYKQFIQTQMEAAGSN